MSAENPYQAPEASIHDDPFAAGSPTPELAGRGTRLGAVMLDGLFYAILMIPMGVAIVADPNMEGGAAIGVLLTVVLALGLFVYQLVLLAQNGWTLGKKILGIRIVRTDHADAGLGRIFWLRMFVPGLLGAIPFLGYLWSIVDPLFIFAEDRQCLHDKIADTIVIVA